VVREHGVEGATVAEIAAHAGMSVGNVYRRFDSKSALVKALEQELLAGREGFWDGFLAVDCWTGRTLGELVRAVVDEILEAHQRHVGLLRALATHHRAEYEARVPEVGAGPAALLTERILTLWPEEVTHPRPHRAIPLAFEMVSATVGELMLFRRGGPERLGLDRDSFAEELTRLVIAYL
jgi:AcrR family transcriptional regulator